MYIVGKNIVALSAKKARKACFSYLFLKVVQINCIFFTKIYINCICLLYIC